MQILDRDHVRAAGMRVFPPLVPASMLAAGWALGRVAPLPALSGWARWTGAGLALLGLALMVWALMHQYRRGSDPNPFTATAVLVVDGPYRFSRNPVYLADLLVQAGIALWFDWAWAVALLPATWLGLRILVIAKEERYLHLTFGEAYVAYGRRVRRWI